MTGGIFELAVVVGLAALLGIILRILKQPLILAYVATGACISVLGLFQLPDRETFQIFSDLGIMFLLFLVGLEMNYVSLKLVGKSVILIGITQIVLTSLIAIVLGLVFGFNWMESVFIGAALAFSSTIIVVKALSDQKEVNSLFGKLSIGILLVQDVAAILILFFLTSFIGESTTQWATTLQTIGYGAVLFVLIILIGHVVFPPLMRHLRRSPELVFVVTLAWLFMVVAMVHQLGFSLEIGGFLAGVALAQSAEHMQITHRISALRDFFLLMFFVILGSSLIYTDFQGLIIPILVCSAFVLLGKPLITILIMGVLGYRKRTGFLTGITTAQISEFSLILVALGMQIGYVSNRVVSLVTAVGIITITLSTYEMMYSNHLYALFTDWLKRFERKNILEPHWSKKKLKKPIVLLGCHRTGMSILSHLPKDDVLVIDFDPGIIHQLKQQGIATVFGDMSDPEVLAMAQIQKADLVISTNPDIEDNLGLLGKLKLTKKKPLVLTRAETEREAEVLYAKGADYVLLPHFTSGYYLGLALAKNRTANKLKQLKRKDIQSLHLQILH